MDFEQLKKEFIESGFLKSIQDGELYAWSEEDTRQVEWMIAEIERLKKKLQTSRESIIPLSDDRDELEFQNRQLKEEIERLKKKQ